MLSGTETARFLSNWLTTRPKHHLFTEIVSEND